mmetsp:Transcript_19257/g.3123  ORF Transcript_19257/g.3123 Transcript_19257/m.3123 type:complete len:88 (+) Transcript_19257:1048-1311(+)
MIIGENSSYGDLDLNPCKEKRLTNIRAASKDEKVKLSPYKEFTIEEAFTYINHDELVEVTPKHIRIRKKILDGDTRRKESKRSKKSS